MGNTKTQWIDLPGAKQGSLLRLFCFPYAGGSAQMFRAWQRFFPREVSLSPVHLPGRAQRINEPPFKRLKPLVDAVTDAMIHCLPDAFAFWGHSMGALISFEVARALRRKGRSGPLALFVSGRIAPQIPDPDPPTFCLSDPEFIARLGQLNGTPKEFLAHPELIQVFLPTIRADFELAETYMYEPEGPLACPIYAYGGMEDKDVTVDNLRAWQEQTSGKCEVRVFPGDHFFIHSSTATVISALSNDLLRVSPWSTNANKLSVAPGNSYPGIDLRGG
jgi:medium-chain acyl-[acyl-carrier-protein] hydrolase